MTKTKTNALPPLAFGQGSAVIHKDAKKFGDLIDSAFPGLNAYDPIGSITSFRSTSVVIPLATSKVVSTAISPTIVDRKNNPSLTFIIPFAGTAESTYQTDGKTVRWGLGRGGLFIPSDDRHGVGAGGFRSLIMWQVALEKLQSTAMSMFSTMDPVNLHLDEPRLLPIEVAGVRTDISWQAMLPLLQIHQDRPDILNHLGVEDILYRHTVMLLRPDLFEKNLTNASDIKIKARSRKVLETLCECISEHLANRWTLTDLERLSGLSGRSLQLAFKSHFDTSPMGWIKEARLARVRQELLARPDLPVEAIAQATGFQSMPVFFKAYKERYGETPGRTRPAY